ncbi:MAG: hypothetical protein GY847_30515 [Proteobacteria bacterium]|nr:hypothetical protein [Pseudomonadota bacterium]
MTDPFLLLIVVRFRDNERIERILDAKTGREWVQTVFGRRLSAVEKELGPRLKPPISTGPDRIPL